MAVLAEIFPIARFFTGFGDWALFQVLGVLALGVIIVAAVVAALGIRAVRRLGKNLF